MDEHEYAALSRTAERANRAEAEAERLRDLLLGAVDAARTFNRNGMSWKEYDALLARLEAAGKRAGDV